MKYLGRIVAIVMGLVAANAYALPSTVSQDGLDLTVSASISGQTLSMTMLLEFGDATIASSWVGTTMDAISFQFGCAGNNCNAIIDRISEMATTSSNVTGEWTGLLGKVSGNGCEDNMSESVCYTRLGTGTVDTWYETVILENASYSFMFDVTFFDGVDIAELLEGSHSVKFLSLKKVGCPNDCRWTTGNQLSRSVPEPGTLALLGAGLLSLTLTRRRKIS